MNMQSSDPVVPPLEESRPDESGLSGRDKLLKEAMQPIFRTSLIETFEKDGHHLADSLYPLIGRAVRRSVRESLKALAQSIDGTMRGAFSVKQFRWRMEAKRKGIPFNEFVLRKSLLYSVEEVFLIHRETGLLIQHVGVREDENRDLVSGMFTAIQDFAADSFRSDAEKDTEQSLVDFKVGDHEVWLVHGPLAYLAVVFSGEPPLSLREEFHATLEKVHERYGPKLANYEGDSSVFSETRLLLDDCLVQKMREEAPKKPFLFYILAAIALALLAFWAFRSWTARQLLNGMRAQLEATPGVIVTEAEKGPSFQVLSDPSVGDVESMLKREFPDRPFKIKSSPFLSLDPDVVVARARNRFGAFTVQDVDSVQVQVVDGVLIPRGTASERWIRQAEKTVPLLGVQGVDFSQLINRDRVACEEFSRDLLGVKVHFLPNQWKVAPAEALMWSRLAMGIRGLATLAEEGGLEVKVYLYAGPAPEPATESDLALARERTLHAKAQLLAHGVEADFIETKDFLPQSVIDLKPDSQDTEPHIVAVSSILLDS